jgi:hypothetical protein
MIDAPRGGCEPLAGRCLVSSPLCALPAHDGADTQSPRPRDHVGGAAPFHIAMGPERIWDVQPEEEADKMIRITAMKTLLKPE